jgi:ABC-type protease/lipase transport system fused ATPase/permease subunit
MPARLSAFGVLSMCINVLVLTGSIYMLQVYDHVLTGRSTATLFFLTLIAIRALLVLALFGIVCSRTLRRISTWLEKRLVLEAFAMGIAASLYAKPYRTDSLHDIQQLRAFPGGANIVPLFDAPWVPLYLVVIFALHPVLGMVTRSGVVLVFGCALLNELGAHKPLQEANRSAIQMVQQATTRAAEAIDAYGGMTPIAIARWQAEGHRAFAQQVVVSARAGASLAAA